MLFVSRVGRRGRLADELADRHTCPAENPALPRSLPRPHCLFQRALPRRPGRHRRGRPALPGSPPLPRAGLAGVCQAPHRQGCATAPVLIRDHEPSRVMRTMWTLTTIAHQPGRPASEHRLPARGSISCASRPLLSLAAASAANESSARTGIPASTTVRNLAAASGRRVRIRTRNCRQADGTARRTDSRQYSGSRRRSPYRWRPSRSRSVCPGKLE